MRKHLKHALSFILVPFTRWYLRKDRHVEFDGIKILVRSGVFHPGLFYSTKFLLTYLSTQDLKGKKFLELGSGSGLISIFAAKRLAIVTASDISRKAVDNTSLNAKRNSADVTVLHSDLFASVERQTFDWIVINPPYYRKKPVVESEYAWYCGEQFEYFETLFEQLHGYCNSSTQIIMVLTKGCDMKSILAIAIKNNYLFELIQEKDVLFDEKDYLFRIRRSGSSRAIQA